MKWKREWKPLVIFTAIFLVFFYLPVGNSRFNDSIIEAFRLTKWYAREHILLCLVPAFFIAGAIAVFISQESVMKYLGSKANKILAYGVASVSGSILAVCSCTVLPLFAGIYKMGAGLGPAVAFLYSGPAINVLAIILTARVLGLKLGIARAVGAILFSIIIGLLMQMFFPDNKQDEEKQAIVIPAESTHRPLWQNGIYFAVMVIILIFANWGESDRVAGIWYAIYSYKWLITGVAALGLAVILVKWMKVVLWKVIAAVVPTFVLALAFPQNPLISFGAGVIGLSLIINSTKGEANNWLEQTWGFTKQILPLLFFGVLVAGFLLGRPGHGGIIPSHWISNSVGGNSLGANLFASVAGAFMYFATLTEVPILQGLMGNGMGKGPALALLLAGPALSLPNMLVIRSVMGNKKTFVYVSLVVVMATITGMIFGAMF